MIIICDLDGTLSDHSERAFLEANRDYDAYHARCRLDPIFPKIGFLLMELANVGHYIVFMTARTEKYRGDTVFWLSQNIPSLTRFSLHMRGNEDTRPSREVKQEMYEKLQADLPRGVWFVLEDKPSVVEMWTSLGLTVLQVHHGS